MISIPVWIFVGLLILASPMLLMVIGLALFFPIDIGCYIVSEFKKEEATDE